MKYAVKMRKELEKELREQTPDDLYSIYQAIISWDGTFADDGIDRFAIDDLSDMGMLKSVVADLSTQRLDYNPLYCDYLTCTLYGWEPWKESTLYDHIEELCDYLIENAGYSGFPGWELENAYIEPFGEVCDDLERYCEIIRDHIYEAVKGGEKCQ